MGRGWVGYSTAVAEASRVSYSLACERRRISGCDVSPTDKRQPEIRLRSQASYSSEQSTLAEGMTRRGLFKEIRKKTLFTPKWQAEEVSQSLNVYVETLNLMLTSKLSCSLTLNPLNKTRGEFFLVKMYTMCTPPGILPYKKYKSQTGLSTTQTQLRKQYKSVKQPPRKVGRVEWRFWTTLVVNFVLQRTRFYLSKKVNKF